MSWRVEVKPTAEKQYLRLDRKTRARILEALRALEKVNDPLSEPRVRALTGKLQGDYRLRVGKWRILFTPDPPKMVLQVFAVLPRGKAYK